MELSHENIMKTTVKRNLIKVPCIGLRGKNCRIVTINISKSARKSPTKKNGKKAKCPPISESLIKKKVL